MYLAGKIVCTSDQWFDNKLDLKLIRVSKAFTKRRILVSSSSSHLLPSVHRGIYNSVVHEQIIPRKKLFLAFTPRTKILKREFSRRKLREISRKFAQTIFFSPRDFAECLREISRRYSAKTQSQAKKRLKFCFV